jgi:hypothetical protein
MYLRTETSLFQKFLVFNPPKYARRFLAIQKVSVFQGRDRITERLSRPKIHPRDSLALAYTCIGPAPAGKHAKSRSGPAIAPND